jgi:hypothetical protein
MRNRSYRELRRLDTFDERFEYLSLKANVGDSTFGFDRYINQQFYTSKEWRDVRQTVIARDLGCDLGVDGYEIFEKVIIHHMNPMTVDDISHSDSSILDPDNLITTTHNTHNAIHYGDKTLLRQPLVERQVGDTRLWGSLSRR